MAEQKLDIEFIKENLGQKGLLEQVGWGALKALVSTVVILGAVISVQNVAKLAEYMRFYVYTSIFAGVVASVLLAVHYYYSKKLSTWFDVIYTNAISTEDNAIALGIKTLEGVIAGLLVALILYISQYDPKTAISVGGCCFAATVFIYYVFRNKLVNLKSYVIYLLYGCATGTAAYLLGSLIVIAMGLIGFWLTIGILVSETAFTAIYTYLGLLEWVDNEKNARKRQAEYEAKQKAEEAKLFSEDAVAAASVSDRLP
jgi:hypothetical protein